MSCKTCIFFREHTMTRQTSAERYEADTRPEAIGFVNKFKWFWNPNAFRQSPPDCIDSMFDDSILLRRNIGYGTCQRFPEAVNHLADFHCGEYQNV